MKNIWIIAQADGDAPATITATPLNEQGEETTTTLVPADPNAPATTQKKSSPYTSMIMMGLMFVVMYFILFRGPRKKQQQHKQMVQTLQKNDKVRTIGGIIGTIVDIKDDEVTLKVDEATNTKIKVIVSAIGKNTSQDKK